MTLLCVPIFVDSVEQAKRDAVLAAEHGADLVELRIDRLTAPVKLPDMPLPFVVTCRTSREGGESELPDGDRIDLLRHMAASSSYVDIEAQSLPADPIGIDPKKIIASSHDFKGRPERLYNLIEELNQSPATINKIVWMARSIRDNIEAFEILQQRRKPTIALCMGEVGLISRVLAKKFGAFLTFASLRDESATAPGQVSIHDMKRLYRWDAITPATKVYGVVGSPVMHSMSPAIHNAGFDAVGHDGVYLPLLVNPGYESFKAFMESFLAFEPLHLSGLSVTLPHKENALRYLKEKGAEVEELAERIGTVNTIVIDGGKFKGFNTDYAAILDTITTALGITRDDLAEKRVAVIGAGGTGRTAVAALAEYGATVVVYNRTMERADELAREFNGRRGKVVAARMEKLCDSCCHIFINATSVGMHPNVDESPLGERLPAFSSDTLVFDTIYNPIETKLLRQAKAAGAKTVGGVEMFVRQAARQFEAWTAKPAPIDIFRRVVEERLAAGT
ncbi:MAG: 3-dehydroquinate dehydratase / shikimate dehydrogenase [Humisphaera sp.]|nr:3-dehydroquinate dehydratase / shikimate dehydrogenase [Humisphaera sp.]